MPGSETCETWPFECLRCLHAWTEEFVHLCDAYGNGGDIWLSSGVPVPPPWSGACCPACGAYRVTWYPSGRPARHREPGPEPEPEPALAPAEPPDRASAPFPERTPLPGRLLIALGVPLALFVGYELYAGAVAAAHPQP
ncbi:hypothetical protein HD597_001493 [Nonomuraea thailandensis]|uniref:Uncharacterized protein n=1 Tax=Nonomuraea thailandensis TaxID=1188745 RepID=A0A9X2JZ42_9ACTN|nr:hypothetical protein [Nonomuraea thailandensis]MCP2354473.1 hypothetical protein [Nonomuraea thailandensis]